MKITSQIYSVGGSSETHAADAAIYLIKSGKSAALVDAGTGGGTERLFRNIQNAGVAPEQIEYLFITHCHFDHTGGANDVRKRTGCRIVAHELDAEFLETGDSEITAASWYGTYMEPTKVDIKIAGGPEVYQIGGLEVSFIHAPGHSPGSSILTVTSDGLLVLFGQDVHGPLNDALRSVRGDYIKTLEFMLSLDADILCEGHFGVYAGKDKVRHFIESFL